MNWYEDEVQRVVFEKSNWHHQPSTVFYGSSSIRQWDTLENDFAEFSPANMGFGGSTLEACVWYFDRLFADVTPKSLIVYAGDNDLGDGAKPEHVFYLFQELIKKVRSRFGDITVGYISIKPSVARFNIVDKIKKTNSLIEAEIKQQGNHLCFLNIFNEMLDENGKPKSIYFDKDGLHINQLGYNLWKKVIYSYIISGGLKI